MEGESATPQTRDECGCFRMAKRDFADQPPTAFAAATGADHVRRRAGFVEEDQPLTSPNRLPKTPSFSPI